MTMAAAKAAAVAALLAGAMAAATLARSRMEVKGLFVNGVDDVIS